MAAGLQVLNSAGIVVLDITDDTGKIVGISSITARTAGSVTDSKFASGIPFWAVVLQEASAPPAVSFNSGTNTLSWDNTAVHDGTIVYGII